MAKWLYRYKCEMFSVWKKKRLKYVFGATRSYRFWTLYFRLTLTNLYTYLYIGTGAVHYLSRSPLKLDAFFNPFLYFFGFLRFSLLGSKNYRAHHYSIQTTLVFFHLESNLYIANVTHRGLSQLSYSNQKYVIFSSPTHSS